VTETLEVVPRQWKGIQTVRERFSRRRCEAITQPPAPFHVTPRGFAGPSLLAMILFEKVRPASAVEPVERALRARGRRRAEPVDAGRAGGRLRCAAPLRPLHALIEAHVLAADRLHGDDTTVPILAKGQTETGRVWVYVRDDRPFGGKDPPAALFYASRDRTREHPERHLSRYACILQADAFDGYNRLYLPDRKPGPIVEALCWSHARRKFFELADIAANARRGKSATPISPIALEAVKRIDALFDIERKINGLTAEARLRARRKESAALIAGQEDWMRAERAKLSRHAAVAKAMDHMLTRWGAFTRFLHDGRIRLTNNAAERALRVLALGRKSWLFAGSEREAERAASMYTLIQPQSSIMSIRKLGSPTSSPGSPTRHRQNSPSSSRGTRASSPCANRRHSRGLRRRVTGEHGDFLCS
jgi:transposase